MPVMSKRLSWSEIKDTFKNQWVELVDCDWDPCSHHPESACVRNAAPRHNALVSKVARSGKLSDSAILYLGAISPVLELDASLPGL